jgi:acid stress-induced BolA-like protein IbaG/YrbA
MTADEVKKMIVAGVKCEECLVRGDGAHWFAEIVSIEFEGLGTIARHQLVYKTVQVELANNVVHALSLKTFTPSEWSAK